jgi:hypothetical protein
MLGASRWLARRYGYRARRSSSSRPQYERRLGVVCENVVQFKALRRPSKNMQPPCGGSGPSAEKLRYDRNALGLRPVAQPGRTSNVCGAVTRYDKLAANCLASMSPRPSSRELWSRDSPTTGCAPSLMPMRGRAALKAATASSRLTWGSRLTPPDSSPPSICRRNHLIDTRDWLARRRSRCRP